MRFDVITIFPDILDSYFQKGMLRIAQEKNIIKIKTHDLRHFAVDKHGTVDDRPYGGGPGQILMVEPVFQALKKIKMQKAKGKINLKNKKKKIKTILLSAKGKTWNQQMARKFAEMDQIIFICPRYEGHDERIGKFADEEISIGNYILTGGELAAGVIIDSVARLLPGVLGKKESLKEESHETPGFLEYPQYTRPETFTYSKTTAKAGQASKTTATAGQASKTSKKSKKKKLMVPKVLLSGHHKNILEWRKKHSERTS